MKKAFHSFLSVLLVIVLCGCNSFQIHGLDSFSENDCCFGLNYKLLPEGRCFLSNYPYENGDYQYWRNNYGQAQAKTYVRLQYSEAIYQQAKLACQEYFTFSEEQYTYENFVFYGVNIADSNTEINATYPGFRMFGYNDDICSLVFIGYLNDSDANNPITTSNFGLFFDNQYGGYFEN